MLFPAKKNSDSLTLLKNFYALALLGQHSSMKHVAGPEEQTFLSRVGGVGGGMGGAGSSNSPCLPTYPLSSFLLTAEFSTLPGVGLGSEGWGSEGSGSECTPIMLSVSSGESTSSSCERQRTDSTRVIFSQRAFLAWPLILTLPQASHLRHGDGDLLLGTCTMTVKTYWEPCMQWPANPPVRSVVFLFPLQEDAQAAQVHLARKQQKRAPGWVSCSPCLLQ